MSYGFGQARKSGGSGCSWALEVVRRLASIVDGSAAVMCEGRAWCKRPPLIRARVVRGIQPMLRLAANAATGA